MRISGTGERAQYFVDEIARAKTQLPNLVFEYPDPAEVISIQRDLTDRGMKLKKAKLEFQRQLELLDLDDEERELVVEDLKSVKKEL